MSYICSIDLHLRSGEGRKTRRDLLPPYPWPKYAWSVDLFEVCGKVDVSLWAVKGDGC